MSSKKAVRAIRIDKKNIINTADKALKILKKGLENAPEEMKTNRDLSDLAENAHFRDLRYKFKNVKGEEFSIPLEVQIAPKKLNWPRKGFYRADLITKKIKNVLVPLRIIFGLSGKQTIEKLLKNWDDVRKEFISLFMHEATHAYDIIHEGSGNIDYKKYLNHPVEIKAYMQQVVAETQELFINKARETHGTNTLKLDGDSLLHDVLYQSDTWSRINRLLTKENRKKIIKGFVTGIQDILQETRDKYYVPLMERWRRLEERRQKNAARAIRIDKKNIIETTNKILTKFKERLNRLPAARQERDLDEIYHKIPFPKVTYTLKNVKGKTRHLKISFQVKKNTPGRKKFVSGGSLSWVKEGNESEPLEITFNLIGSQPIKNFLHSGELFKKELFSIFIHEATHAYDVMSEGSQGLKTEDYYNHPSEVKAYLQQIVDETQQEFIAEAQRTEGYNTFDLEGYDMLTLLRKSPTWNKISRVLSPSNRKLIMKGFITGIQDIQQETRDKYYEDWDDGWDEDEDY